jgi:hypothetical protein
MLISIPVTFFVVRFHFVSQPQQPQTTTPKCQKDPPIATMPSSPTMFLLPLLLALSMVSVAGLSRSLAEPQCACTFLVPAEEEPQCALYGEDNIGALVDFERISDSCLSALTISERVLEVDRLFLICPNGNETDASITNFITFIRLYATNATYAIKTNPDFARWFQTMDDGSLEVIDEIITQQQGALNCTESIELCWNEIKLYVFLNPPTLKSVCEDLYEQQIEALQKEQSMARSRICQEDESVVPEECTELKERIKSFMADNGDLECSDLGTRAAASRFPNRESCNLGDAVIVQDRSAGAAWATGCVGILSWVVLVGLLTLQ